MKKFVRIYIKKTNQIKGNKNDNRREEEDPNENDVKKI